MAKDMDVPTGDADQAGRRRLALVGSLALLLAAMIFAVLSALRFGSHANADALVSSIASIQGPTLFYWGQNRILSVMPFALSWEKDPFANLFLSSAVCALSFYLLLLLVARFANKAIREGDVVDQALCFLILCVVFLAGSTSLQFYFFAVDPSQPYALSYLLLVTAAWLIFFSSSYPTLSVLGAGVAAFIATGVNFSVILAAVAMSLTGGWFTSVRKACLFFGLCAASFVFWYWVSRHYHAPGGAYYGLSGGPIDNLSASLRRVVASIRPIPVALLVATLIASTALARGKRSRPLAIFTGTLIAFGLVWWMVISQNAWAQANGLNARYFFPTLLCFGVALGVGLWARAVTAPGWAKIALIGVLAISILGILLRPVQRLSSYPVFAKAAGYAAFARAHDIRYVSGNYWQAWPVVFLLLDRPDAAFAMAYRGEAVLSKLRKAVKRDARGGSPVRALCLEAKMASCQSILGAMSGQNWEAAPLACPGSCWVLALTPRVTPGDAVPH